MLSGSLCLCVFGSLLSLIGSCSLLWSGYVLLPLPLGIGLPPISVLNMCACLSLFGNRPNLSLATWGYGLILYLPVCLLNVYMLCACTHCKYVFQPLPDGCLSLSAAFLCLLRTLSGPYCSWTYLLSPRSGLGLSLCREDEGEGQRTDLRHRGGGQREEGDRGRVEVWNWETTGPV